MVTAKAQVTNRQEKRLQGEATVYNEVGRPVMEFSSTFRIAKDARIRDISTT
jgi:hypothetical protein